MAVPPAQERESLIQLQSESTYVTRVHSYLSTGKEARTQRSLKFVAIWHTETARARYSKHRHICPRVCSYSCVGLCLRVRAYAALSWLHLRLLCSRMCIGIGLHVCVCAHICVLNARVRGKERTQTRACIDVGSYVEAYGKLSTIGDVD